MIENLMGCMNKAPIMEWEMGNWVSAMSDSIFYICFDYRIEPLSEFLISNSRCSKGVEILNGYSVCDEMRSSMSCQSSSQTMPSYSALNKFYITF
jgi:hypothetical protein